jgi:MscS family membrane protein
MPLNARLSVALSLLVLGVCLVAVTAQAQTGPAGSASKQTDGDPKDPLGRQTPRGSVLGFLTAARQGQDDLAVRYLNTDLQGRAAADLARQLFAVLDSRLPARLNQLSDRPEGSFANPLKPHEDVIGTISSATGPLDIVVEKVDRGASGSLWLFSRRTLESIPRVYADVDLVAIDKMLPRVLVNTYVAGIRLFDWIGVCVGVPLLYWLIALLNRFLTRTRHRRRQRKDATGKVIGEVFPGPVRLLMTAGIATWVLSGLDLPLLERQLWSTVLTTMVITAVVWTLLWLTRWIERYVERRLLGTGFGGGTSIVRLARRVVDVLVIFAGVVTGLQYFGVNPTAAMAGLGIGGIAVALAAQKTLENVIGGLSLILDQAVRVGDVLKIGTTQGTVDHIGLRSTRIRTPDRTVVSVPNGQIANATIETTSSRDKYWFHHVVALRHETTSAQMRSVVADFRTLVEQHPLVDPGSVAVRFVRLGGFSLDVDISAYFLADDGNDFLVIQEELLLHVMELVERAGTRIAIPSQTMYLADPHAGRDAARRPPSESGTIAPIGLQRLPEAATKR